jgi:LPXTG-motif cell wall-anchored protein
VPQPPLSYTGVNVAWMLSVGLLVLLGGLALIIIGRRREARRMH